MKRATYNKLVRDGIPEILQKEGLTVRTSIVPQPDRAYHLYLKLLEECHQLFRSGNRAEFVREAADLLEVVRALATANGVDWETIEAERVAREQELGGFSEGVFLLCVQNNKRGRRPADDASVTPCLLTRRSSPSLLDVLGRELANSCRCRIAVAFCTRGMLNQLMRPFERFLAQGGRLQILTSVMNNFNNPDDLLHVQDELPIVRFAFSTLETTANKSALLICRDRSILSPFYSKSSTGARALSSARPT